MRRTFACWAAALSTIALVAGLDARAIHIPTFQPATLAPLVPAKRALSEAVLRVRLRENPRYLRPQAADVPFDLGRPTGIADGIDLFHPSAESLLEARGPLAVQALRVDTTRARLAIGLADGATPARRPVVEIVERAGALAGVNASFFDSLGHQQGLLVLDATVLATSPRPRGAVAWIDVDGQHRRSGAAGTGRDPEGPRVAAARFVFDRVRSSVAVRVGAPGTSPVQVDHVNAPASRGGVSLYTSAFRLPIWGRTAAQAEEQPGPVGAPPTTTATPAATGGAAVSTKKPRFAAAWRWLLGGTPLRVIAVIRDGKDAARVGGQTSSVLVFRGNERALPSPLRGLQRGSRIDLIENYDALEGSSPGDWATAAFAVAGAGLLVRDGHLLDDWTVEALRTGFATERHPRTMIGTDGSGNVWLIAVDGRRPGFSVGMSFVELQRLAVALGLTNALNLDGGGSTTMVVRSEIVNRPSDLTGPRPVPDAILVNSR